MAVYSGPKVVTDGMILYLDKYNEESYLGEPTVNLMTNPVFQNQTAGSSSAWGWGTGYSGTRYYLEDNPPEGDLYFGLYCSTPNVWMEHAQLTNLTASTTYKLSYWVRAAPAGTDYWNTIYVYALTDDQAVLSTGIPVGGTWVRHTTQFTTRSTTQNYRISSFNYTAGMTLYISGIQIEEKSHVTKFVDGTRSATDGWRDLSGNNNHADLTSLTYSATKVPGTLVNDFSFNGTNDYVDNGSALVTGNNSWTVDFWMYPTGTGTPFFMGTHFASQALVTYWENSGNTIRVGVWASDRLIATISCPINQWSHVVWSWDETTLRAYINGSTAGTATGFSFNINSSMTRLGAASTSQYFGGKLSSVVVYNRALTAIEVLQNFNASKGRYGL